MEFRSGAHKQSGITHSTPYPTKERSPLEELTIFGSMPFYSCAFRSLSPTTDALALAEDEDKGCVSSLLLLSRLIRENACTWLSSNLKPIVEGIKNQNAKRGPGSKVTIEAWRLMPHLRLAFSLIVEMVAVIDLADESLVSFKMFDHLMEQVRTYMCCPSWPLKAHFASSELPLPLSQSLFSLFVF